MAQDENSAEAGSLKEQGLKMFRFGEYEEAAESFEKARDLYKTIGDQTGEAEMLNNLGAVHTHEERWKEAREAFEKAAEIFVASGDEDGHAQTLGNLGTMYRYQGDSDTAVAYLKQAIELFHEAGDAPKEAATLGLISRIRLGQAKWLEALHFYDLSLACVQPPGVKQRILRRLTQVPFGLLSRPG
jgi:tetratricopeptide (TPR) repeat protein